MIDTHAHLCAPEFAHDLGEVLERAQQAGVERVVAVSETLAEARRTLEIARANPTLVSPAAGLFPTRLDLEEAKTLRSWLRENRPYVVAVGEVGLDYWKVQEKDDRALQREIFAGFVRLAMELDLPLNVHSRSAGRATIEFLLELGAKRVQLHAFDGRAATAQPAVEAGYFFSVPPSIVRSRQKQKLFARLPLSQVLLETDSPVLGADPQERNEPANLSVGARALAEIHSVPLEQVWVQTGENARLLYGW